MQGAVSCQSHCLGSVLEQAGEGDHVAVGCALFEVMGSGLCRCELSIVIGPLAPPDLLGQG